MKFFTFHTNLPHIGCFYLFFIDNRLAHDDHNVLMQRRAGRRWTMVVGGLGVIHRMYRVLF